jgi:TrkA domain protein
MPIDVRETRLPGIGVRYEFKTMRGGRLAVIHHNDGSREIYLFRRGDAEPREVIQLTEGEGRQLAAVLGGPYERTKIIEDLEMAIGELGDLAIEWVPVPEGSHAIGKSLAECGFRAKTGITVIAILREPEPVTGAQPHDVVQRGDTLITVGKRGQYSAFRKLLEEGTLAEDRS